MKAARAAAVVTWVYALGFALPAPVVAWFVLTQGRLPWFAGLFPMYGGPWSARVGSRAFVGLLAAFMAVGGLAVWSGWLVWHGSRRGAIINLALIPVEVIFWIGFALPIPWLIAVARIGLLGASWRSLRPARPPVLSPQ